MAQSRLIENRKRGKEKETWERSEKKKYCRERVVKRTIIMWEYREIDDMIVCDVAWTQNYYVVMIDAVQYGS